LTRQSIEEYAEAVRERYQASKKAVKQKILDEFVAATGRHRKAAIRLLNKPGGKKAVNKRRGRPKGYSLEAVSALRVVWEASDRLCSKRFHPFLPELVEVMKRYEELVVTEEVEGELRRMSASTIDRALRLYRTRPQRHGLSTTRPSRVLKSAIPLKTFGEWSDSEPGYIEIDLVAHCGDSTQGFYLNTLSAVDVATGWYEAMAVWGKYQEHVTGAIHKIRNQIPMTLKGVHSDSGSEFINQKLYGYCKSQNIEFTRSRSYKKNDNCHVEQKNWQVVRRIIGYDRFSSKEALRALDSVYTVARLYINFFQPVMKLVGKSRNGARVHKVFDTAQTPYQRLLASGVLTREQREALSSIYGALNPVKLLKQIERESMHLWSLADKK